MNNAVMDNKIESVQALRALAVCWIILHHVMPAYQALGGQDALFAVFSNCGVFSVDYLFVVSGFAIYLLVERQHRRPEDASRFLLTRFVRIYPFYWMCLPLYLFLTYALDHRSVDLVGSVLLLQPDMIKLVMPVAWTLVYEVAFYLIVGICILLGISMLRFFFIYTIVIAAGQFFDSKLFILSPTFIDFLLGILVAWKLQPLIEKIDKTPKRVLMALIALGVAVVPVFLAVKLFLKGGQWVVDPLIYRPLFCGLSAVGWLVCMLCLSRNWPRWMVLVNKAGDAAFSVYLLHMFILSMCYYTGIIALLAKLNAPFLGVLALVLICFLAGYLWFIWVENPLYLRFKTLVKRYLAVGKEKVGVARV